MSLNQPTAETLSEQEQEQEAEPAPPSPNTTKAPYKKIESSPYSDGPRGYFVYLLPGHTLAQHSAAIGRDIQPHISRVLDSIHKDRTVYIGKNIDEELLDLIRMDKGVEYVRDIGGGGYI